MDEPQDPGDLLEVAPEHRLNRDPKPSKDPTHAALGDGGPDDVSDVEEGEVVAPEDFVDDPEDEAIPQESETDSDAQPDAQPDDEQTAEEGSDGG